MKLNRKIIIPAATLLIGVALAGSATSTIAWYQYSTKANVAYIGTSAGTSGNLLVRINEGGTQAADAGWGTHITHEQVGAFLSSKKIQPITSGAMGKDSKLPTKFYANPVAGNGPLNLWNEANATNYVQIPLQFKFVEKTVSDQNSIVETQVAKDLYLSDLLIQNDHANATNQKRDLSSAIRVHFEGYLDNAAENDRVYRLASLNGGDTLTVGHLDLDGDGKDDKSYAANEREAMYGFVEDNDNIGTPIEYGTVTGQTNNNQVSYSATDILNIRLGSVPATSGSYLNVMVTIWIEGWQALPKTSDNDTNTSSMWDLLSTVNSQFDVGMQFEAKTAA